MVRNVTLRGIRQHAVGLGLLWLVVGGAVTSATHAQCGTANESQTIEGEQQSFIYGAEMGSAFASKGDNDGSTVMVVGVPLASAQGVAMAGKAIVYRRFNPGDAWQFEAELTAPDGEFLDLFGSAVAMWIPGSTDRIFVGAPNAGATPGSEKGAVYTFERIAGVWTYVSKIAPTDSGLGDFGAVMGCDGPLVIGDPAYNLSANTNDSDVGRVFVYSISTATPVLTSTVPSPNPTEGGRFGNSISVSGSEFVVGQGNGINGIHFPPVHHYEIVLNQPTLRQTLTGDVGLEYFGYSVSLEAGDNMLLIGAPGRVPQPDGATLPDAGSAHLYKRLNSNSPWVRYQTLTRDVPEAWDRFGESVTFISNFSYPPGQRIMYACAGAPGCDPSGLGQTGAAFVFRNVSGVWQQQPVIAPPATVDHLNDKFGLFMHGLTLNFLSNLGGLIVGAPFEDTDIASDAGAAHSYIVYNQGTQNEQVLSEDFDGEGRFGQDIDISGDTMVVGAQFEDSHRVIEGGTADVFNRTGGTWHRAQTLVAPGTGSGDHLGRAVAISGDYIAVAAPDYDDLPGGPGGVDCGSVAIFRWDGVSWVFHQRILAPDRQTFDAFGASVDMSGSLLIVGATGDNNVNGSNAGSAYVFQRDASNQYAYQSTLVASDGAASDRFGVSVAIGTVSQTIPPVANTVAMVGAYAHDAAGSNGGAVYAFRRDPIVGGVVWNQVQKLNVAAAGDNFGYRSCLSGTTFASTAPVDDVSGVVDAGSVHLFSSSNAGNSWTFTGSITAPDRATADWFGSDIAISGADMIVGAQNDDEATNTNAGSAYRFRLVSGTWTYQQKLLKFSGAAGDEFGTAVGVSGGTFAIGAPLDDSTTGTNTGSVTTYDLAVVGPGFAAHPADVTACVNAPITFGVVPSGAGPFSYQWQHETAPNVWTAIPLTGVVSGIGTTTGQGTATLTFTSVSPSVTRRLRCPVGNACSIVPSNPATLTVTGNVAPTITSQPASTAACVGSPATLTAGASGSEPLTYQWLKDGVNVAGATAPSLSFPAAALTDDASYTCVVTNGCGSTVTTAAELTVEAPLEFAHQPLDVTACVGDYVGFFADFEASPSIPHMAFLWQSRDGTGLWSDVPSSSACSTVGSGWQWSLLNVGCLVDNTVTEYRVMAVTAAGCIVTSRTATLTVSCNSCDTIDYNNDGLFPDTADIDDFLSVFSGASCSNAPHCGDIDFNNDGLFPDTLDIDSLLSVFSGGPCLR